MKKISVILCTILSLLFFSFTPLHAAEIGKEVKITFLGHSAFKVISPKGVVIYIDPFLNANPMTPPELKTVEKADFILVTHGHRDHVGDTLAIAEKTNAKIVVMGELGRHLGRKGAKNLININRGGTYDHQGIGITMVPAFHSSSITEGDQEVYAGEPSGFVVQFENGFTLYHAGDTGVFGDMKIIGEIYKPEISLLPIGGRFTMGPKEAAYAAKLLGSKYVIPMHYGTFPMLTGTVEDFQKWMKEVPKVNVLVMKPGETVQ
jgi:L-ascorbate metabolism protein UlaG (beta-lactamase superfamily)